MLIGVFAIAFAIVLAFAFRHPAAVVQAPTPVRTDPGAVVESTGGRVERFKLSHEDVRVEYQKQLTYADGSTKMLGVTILAALGFLLLEQHDWNTANFHIADNAYATIYYVLTGTHFAHVLAGVALLAAVAIFLRAPAFTREHHAGVEAIAYYWHFVFVVWLVLYATIFFVR